MDEAVLGENYRPFGKLNGNLFHISIYPESYANLTVARGVVIRKHTLLTTRLRMVGGGRPCKANKANMFNSHMDNSIRCLQIIRKCLQHSLYL